MKRFPLYLISVALIFFTGGCTDSGGNFGADLADSSDAADLISYVDAEEDAEVFDQEAYEKECYRTQYWYCPPLDEVWRSPVIVDICKDPPEVIYVGECLEVMECDPSTTIHGEQECTTEAGFPGIQVIYCNKGMFQYGDCETECAEEICDGFDNDCDDQIDEGQTNACGYCGQVPTEVCSGQDDDCDGDTDEDLIKECETACGKGVIQCLGGSWNSCTAQQPYPEMCDGKDNDCDGKIDEGLNCMCTIDHVGVLFPCDESPLLCGRGYKTCECVDPDCIQLTITECAAYCSYEEPLDPSCDPYVGMPLAEEACNNYDDNCNQLIDEDLYGGCYTGPQETLSVGICEPGEMMCLEGGWGHYLEGTFIEGYCKDEVIPEDKDWCNGLDDDCDGVVDYGTEIKETDILFIIDLSGSMIDETNAVFIAMNQFAQYFSEEETIHWGVVAGPFNGGFGIKEHLRLFHDLSVFPDFIASLAQLSNEGTSGSLEMLYDAIYLSLYNLAGPPDPLYDVSALTWKSVGESIPPKENFVVGWRPDATKIIVVFTDEKGQSYLEPEIEQSLLTGIASSVPKLKIHTFTNEAAKENGSFGASGWEPIATATGGFWYLLTSDQVTIYNNLIEILDEACLP